MVDPGEKYDPGEGAWTVHDIDVDPVYMLTLDILTLWVPVTVATMSIKTGPLVLSFWALTDCRVREAPEGCILWTSAPLRRATATPTPMTMANATSTANRSLTAFIHLISPHHFYI